MLALLLACTAADGEEPGNGADSGAAPPLRVILLTLDTIRADHVTAEHMPWLTGLAAEGLVFTNLWGQSWTYSAIGEVLSSRNPATWGADSYNHENAGQGPALIGDDIVLLAENLSADGWATGFWSSNDVAGEATGLHRGYGTTVVFKEGRTEQTAAEIVEWSTTNAGRDQFIHLHVNDAHDPYAFVADSCADAVAALPVSDCRYDFAATDEGQTTIRVGDDLARGVFGPASDDFAACQAVIEGEYACEVRYQDDALAASWQLFADAGLLDGAVIMVLIDHGEGLLDPFVNHAYDIRSTTTRNWGLLISEGVDAGEWDLPMGQDDVVPTLQAVTGRDFGLDSTGLAYTDSFENRVITAYWLGLPPTEKKEVHRHMAVGGGYQYLLTSEGEEELYDLVADPNCQTNVAGTVEVPATLSEALQAQNAMTADYSELD